jgi:hypothetical protein
VHSADVPYKELLKHLFKLDAGYFQLQLASERDRESGYKLVSKYLRDDARGIPQIASTLGCSRFLAASIHGLSPSDPSVWTGRALQAENDDLENVGLALLYSACRSILS